MRYAAYVFGGLFGLIAYIMAIDWCLGMTRAQSDVELLIGGIGLLMLVTLPVPLIARTIKRLRQGKPEWQMPAWLPVFALLAVSVSTSGCGTTINPGYGGIVVDYYGKDRGVQSYTVTTGRVWYNPWTTSVLEWPTFVQTAKWTKSVDEGKPVNEEITFTNADGMAIAADISVSYHLQLDKLPAFYVKFRSSDMDVFTHGFLRNLARDKFDSHGGRYKIEEIMGDNAKFVAEVRADLQKDLDAIGVQVDQFGFIGAPRPPQVVLDSINAKAKAVQLAFQKQNELVQVQADAAKEVAEAEGHARAVLAAADAQASSNRKIAESVSTNLIEWRKIERWDGKLPQVQSGGSGLIVSLPNK